VIATALEAQRVAGERDILPDDVTRADLRRGGATRLLTVVKVCIDAGGRVTSATMLKSSGYPAYDQRLRATIKDTWRYRPYKIDGVAKPVCSSATFIYRS
jgi:TonB family protein